ncbi:MAG: CoB--CoM heterodisulfide reductase iron-sulfur subunit B family protein [bacterium JZ-2024 1]
MTEQPRREKPSEYTVFPGCLITMRYPHFEASSREAVRVFGIELKDAPGFVCCPDPVGLRSMDTGTWLTIAARNLSVAEERGLPVASLCNGCFETLNSANRILKANPDKKEKVNELLKNTGRTYRGTLEVKHLLQVLYERVGPEGVRNAVKRPLAGMVLATHPGCHALRPSPLVQFDHPVEPRVLDEMVIALGAKVKDYPEKMMCCGLPIYNYDKEISFGLARTKLRSLEGVDGLVVTCPSCFMQFENAQIVVRDESIPPVPVYYYFELLAYALGMPVERVGFKNHRVPVSSHFEQPVPA